MISPPRSAWVLVKGTTSGPRLSSYLTRLSDRLSPLHTCLPIDLSSTVNSFLDHRPYYTLLQTNTSNNAVIMNEIFSITCITEANPPAKYIIYRDETRIVGNKLSRRASEAGDLRVQTIKPLWGWTDGRCFSGRAL